MRSARNFNPEWGYLAPAPSFMRTARVVLVATAIGATAGAAVVISLIDRPTGEGDRTALIAPHAIVTSAQAAPATVVPAVAAAPIIAPAKEAAVKPVVTPPSVAASATFPQVTPSIASQVAAAPAVPATVSTPPANNVPAPTDAAVVEPHSTGMASLSEAAPSNGAVRSADAPDQALIPPEPVPDDKKAKHHVASASATNSKGKTSPGLGSMLRRMFNQSSGSSYYPNR